ncbi:MAG: helix-hairpin-helix domain-containing protein, partial [Bacteroidota bacterium]|nr:helix-hairpin-helix domain-containing protein [Bacteroidota bacterium]
ATPETDRTVLDLAQSLYSQQRLRRVYYSGYVPISTDPRMPVLDRTPLVRENRLYQSDWLLRFYGFSVSDLVDEARPLLDLDIDPKTAYALRHPEIFPIDVNTAPIELLLRVPGLGTKSAKLIVQARRKGHMRQEHLRSFGVAMKRAQYFLSFQGEAHALVHQPQKLRSLLIGKQAPSPQLDLFAAA